MATKVGEFEVGVSLALEDLKADFGKTRDMLDRLGKVTADYARETRATAGAVTDAGFKAVKFNAIWDTLSRTIRAATAPLHIAERGIRLVESAFNSTVGAAASFGSEMFNQSVILGESVGRIQAMSSGLEIVTGNAQLAGQVFRFLSRSIGMVAGGGTVEAKQAFRDLGVQVTDSAGRIKSTGDIVEELRVKLMAMPEGARRSALAMGIFGEQGASMLVMFKELTSEGRTWTEYLEDLGLIIDTKVLESAKKLDQELAVLRTQGRNTFIELGASAAPAFAPLVKDLQQLRKQLIDWIRDNRDGIEKVAATFVSKALEIKAALEAMARSLRLTGVSAKDLVTALDAVIYVVEGFALAVGGSVKAVGLLLDADAKLLELLASTPLVGQRYKLLATTARAAADAVNAAADSVLDATKAGMDARDQERTRQESIAKTITYLDQLAERHKELSGAGSPDAANAVALMQESLAKLGDEQDRLPTSLRKYLAELGLVEDFTDDIDGLGGALAGNSAAADQAAKSIGQAIQALEQEKAAMLGGLSAKIEATLASEQLAAASEEEKNKYRELASEIGRLSEVQARIAKGAQALGGASTTHGDRDLALRQQEIELAQRRAEAEGDFRKQIQLTRQARALAAEAALQGDRETYNEMISLRETLRDTESDATDLTLEELIRAGQIKRSTREQELADAIDIIDTEIRAWEGYSEARVRIERETTEQIVAEMQRRHEEEKRAMIDLRGTLTTLGQDIYGAAILGTGKMKDAMDRLWLSLQKQAVDAFADIFFEKLNWEGKMQANFLHLPELLGPGFDGIVEKGKAAFAKLFNLKANAEAPIAGAPTQAVTDAFGNVQGFQSPATLPNQSLAAGPGVGGAAQAAGLAGGAAGALPGAEGPSLATQIGDAMKSALESVTQVLQKGWDFLGKHLSDLAKMFGDGLKAVGKGLLDMGKEIFSGIGKMAGGVVDGLGGALKGLGGSLSGMMTSGFEFVGKGLSFIADSLSQIFTYLAQILVQVARSIFATGGYIGAGGRMAHAATGMYLGRASRGDGSVPIIAHVGEGIINARATAALGGEAAVMALNRGRVPPALMQAAFNAARRAATGLFVPGGPTAATVRAGVPVGPSTLVQQSTDQSVHIGEGAVQVHASPGMDVEQVGRDLMRGIMSQFNR